MRFGYGLPGGPSPTPDKFNSDHYYLAQYDTMERRGVLPELERRASGDLRRQALKSDAVL